HRMIVNGVYELPFFRAQKGFAGPLWEAGRARRSARSTAAVRSASLPLRAARSPQGGGQRPNWAGVNPALETPVPARWFETSHFSNSPAYKFGTVPRTFNGLRSDIARQV